MDPAILELENRLKDIEGDLLHYSTVKAKALREIESWDREIAIRNVRRQSIEAALVVLRDARPIAYGSA